MGKLFRIISYLTLAIAFIMLLTISYWLFYPYKPIEFDPMVFPLVKTELKRGDPIEYKVSYCAPKNSKGTLIRVFVNNVIITLPPKEMTTRQGCFSAVVPYNKIPENIPLGKGYLQLTYYFKVNPLREIIISAKTEDFEIIK